MNRPLLAIGLILLAFGLTAGVFAFANHDRWDDGHRTVEYHITSDSPDGGDGSRVLVVDGDRHWGPGFFPLFPFIVLGGILTVFALAGRGRRYGGGPRHWDARDRFDDWHRTAHAAPGSTPNTPPPGDAPREQ